MSIAATRDSASGTDFKPKPPAPGRETRALLQRVVGRNKTCLPAFRALLADGERGKDYIDAFGSPADWLRESLIKNTAGENPMIEEAIGRKLDSVRSELEGPNPSPIERLLAERASLCWFLVSSARKPALNSCTLLWFIRRKRAPGLKEVDMLIPIGVASQGSKPGGQHVHQPVVSRLRHPRLPVHPHRLPGRPDDLHHPPGARDLPLPRLRIAKATGGW